MGIFIYTRVVPSRIDSTLWAEMYDESLKILLYGQLADTKMLEIHGVQCPCIVQAGDEGGRWDVCGDLITGHNMDNQNLSRQPHWLNDPRADNGNDVLLSITRQRLLLDRG